jgi:hypothetical protein
MVLMTGQPRIMGKFTISGWLRAPRRKLIRAARKYNSSPGRLRLIARRGLLPFGFELLVHGFAGTNQRRELTYRDNAKGAHKARAP